MILDNLALEGVWGPAVDTRSTFGQQYFFCVWVMINLIGRLSNIWGTPQKKLFGSCRRGSLAAWPLPSFSAPEVPPYHEELFFSFSSPTSSTLSNLSLPTPFQLPILPSLCWDTLFPTLSVFCANCICKSNTTSVNEWIYALASVTCFWHLSASIWRWTGPPHYIISNTNAAFRDMNLAKCITFCLRICSMINKRFERDLQQLSYKIVNIARF